LSLNNAEIDLVISELEITGSQIQNIIQPDFSSLFLSLYDRGIKKDLLISLAPGKTRLNLTERRFPKPAKQQRFVQFLKARILGGRIAYVTQPGKERIVKIKIDNDEWETFLWVRLWGGSANIIATDSELTILDLFYRRPGKNEISGGKLCLPENAAQSAAGGAGTDTTPDTLAEAQESGKKGTTYKVRDYPNGKGNLFNTFIDNYYADAGLSDERERIREKITGKITRKLLILKSSLDRVSDELGAPGSFDRFRQYGQLILSSSHLIKPADKWLETENYFDNGNLISIELDTSLTPEENAEKYFKKYKKAKAAQSILQEEKNNIESRIKKLDETLASLDAINDVEKLNKINSEDELKKENNVFPGKSSLPGLQFYSGSYKFLVGKASTENDALLRKHVKGNDYWLHARDYPGSYVFIKYINGKSIPLEILIEGGNLALYFSKGRNSGKGEVYYTQVKYLRRAKGAKTGTVLPTQEKNLFIILDKKILGKLLGRNSEEA
jgi:predicted ribosome quality control (RQC) complex YloA/Tae2 family protein